jgi:hypothetical protein
MPFLGDPRRRSVALLAGGVLLFSPAGRAAGFNTSSVRFLNPETSGETLVFTGLTCWCLPAAAGAADAAAQEHPQALCRPEQQRAGRAAAHAHGAGRGADRAHARGLHVPVQLSADEPLHRPLVFAAEHSELREDSTRVVLELAQYVTNNARVEAESIAASGAPDKDLPGACRMSWLASHHAGRRICGGLWQGLRACWPVFRRRRSRARPACFRGWTGERGQRVPLHGPLSAACFPRRSAAMKPVMKWRARSTRWAWRPPHRARWWWWRCPCRRA